MSNEPHDKDPHGIKALRVELGLSQEAFAERLGLTSKGHMSNIERGSATCSPSAAMAIEALSGGRIKAASISRTLALADAARAQPSTAQSEAA